MQKSSPSKNIPLFNLTRVEPDTDREGCLIVEYANLLHPRSAAAGASAAARKSDTLLIHFKSYDELYTWRDALYDRSPLSAPIGNPTGFKHNTHVGCDPASGEFVVSASSRYQGDLMSQGFGVCLGLTERMGILQPDVVDC